MNVVDICSTQCALFFLCDKEIIELSPCYYTDFPWYAAGIFYFDHKNYVRHFLFFKVIYLKTLSFVKITYCR